MAIHAALTHRTTYAYDRPVVLGPHVVRLRPAPHTRTPVLAYSLRVQPGGHFLNWQQDAFGNHLARLVFPEPSDVLELVVDLVVDLTTINPFDFFVEDDAQDVGFAYDPASRRDLDVYLQAEPAGPLLQAWLRDRTADLRRAAAAGPGADPMRTIDALVALNQRLQADIAYTTRMEPGVQTPEETLEKRLGSCRDSGWLLVQVLRHHGIAARFVSGYLVQLAPDPAVREASLDGPAGPAADFTDLHAWAEAYVPGAGWVGMDPTSGLFAGEGHIPLACTPDPRSAAPVEGLVGPAEVTFEHENTVVRLHEDPRVTKPYSATQWAAVDALGRAVDAALEAGDVRLTQGGEPTFVSVDDADSPQWTTAADGRHKRERAWDLARRLFDRFAGGGLIQHGQGKWYPGEPLPRWQTALHWRGDGGAMWADPGLLADPWRPGTATTEVAAAFAAALAERVGIPADHVHPGYEDALHRLWEEARLPAGPAPAADVDPADDRLVDPDHRRRLLEALDQVDAGPVGYALPLHHDGTGWASARWTFRRGRLVLLPGDSPMGFRLPLPGLSWTEPAAQPDPSAFEPRSDLRARTGGPAPTHPTPPPADVRVVLDDRAQLVHVGDGEGGAGVGGGAPMGVRVVDLDGAPFSAVCVELREGRVHVFAPPLTHLEHLLDLVEAVEDTAAELGTPVVLEGYPPPPDPRLRTIVVAPDPGVVEVNVQPAASWPELVAITEGVYADARQARLGTERFDLDGTHTGSGGGNHLTIGGSTPADSPLLRRPDLLASIVTFWQHHPSLSYLFSGKFVGPTSQAPRVDESRPEALYELETALAALDAEIARAGADGGRPPAWVLDRTLRHLLVDLTGNTHRAELCIDKLHSPDGERGRLGLLELRAFEMPPHPQMAAVQSLLVRALISRFWSEPYRGPLVRWGSALHDRFLLPHFAEADAAEVVADLQQHGLPFEQAWLDPFVEFRFPRLGTAVVGGPGLGEVEVELRRAVEPWHVLGEEATATGTARYVDSSVERVQVAVRGLVPERHVVTCGGVPVPLAATGTEGLAVGAVRYKAWQPPSGLHPTIGVHSPLVFDVVDRWNRRSLGGCRYHVVHQGGRGYETSPVNAVEAEARRAGRFERIGHTPGPVDVEALDRRAAALRLGSPAARAGEHPLTLDLRRPVTG